MWYQIIFKGVTYISTPDDGVHYRVHIYFGQNLDIINQLYTDINEGESWIDSASSLRQVLIALSWKLTVYFYTNNAQSNVTT